MRRGTWTRPLVPAAAAILLLTLALPASAVEPNVTFLSNGDEIQGWQWLRDADGNQYATWSLWGTPSGETVTVTFDLLATDAIDGGPGVDARAWVMVGPIESGAPGQAITGPSLLTFPNVSAADDPVGYQTHGTVTIAPEDLTPGMEGLWVLVERRGPTGEVLSEHIAVNREAIGVTGLTPATTCGRCLPAPEPSPSSVPAA
jgi:hypothetical protein